MEPSNRARETNLPVTNGSFPRGSLSAPARLLACAAAAFSWSTGPLVAQVDDLSAVAAAVLPQLRGSLPSGAAALDPEPFCTPRLIGWRCPDVVRQAAEEAGLALSGREFTLICLQGPTSCRLIGVQSLVAFDDVSVDSRAGRARVSANLWWRPTGGRAPLASRRALFSLSRRRGAWIVDEPDR